jgi:Bacterial Ig-like domain (group 2)
MTRRLVRALMLVLVLGLAEVSCGGGNSGNQLVSITVTPNPATINAPGTLQLKAVGTFSNGMTEVLSSANWTSSSQGVTVNGQGLAACSVSGGPAFQVTVTARADSVSGGTTVNCAPPNP